MPFEPMTVTDASKVFGCSRQHTLRLIAKNPEVVLGKDQRGHYELDPDQIHRLAIRRATGAR